ncbi:MAG: phage tail protein [Glaciimonas sp.]|nr:phage tail protein [Glaciimonas sp.]
MRPIKLVQKTRQPYRVHLAAANPNLQQNPEKLHVFIDEDQIVAFSTGSLSFETATNNIITDYIGNTDALMVMLLAWIAVHQSDLLNNPEHHKTSIRFEFDFNNHENADLSLVIDFTERIIVTQAEQGRLHIKNRPEPHPTPDYADPFWTLYKGDNLLAEWTKPSATSA